MKHLRITADANDADYLEELTPITEEELEAFKPLIEAIKNFKPYKNLGRLHRHNFPRGEYCPRTDLGEKTVEEIYPEHVDVLERFEEFVPYGEYGTHTIVSIEVLEIGEKQKLV